MDTEINENFLNKLSKKGGYSESEIQLLRPKISKLNPILNKALKEWLTSGVIPKIEVADYSIESLMKEQKLSFVAAILTIDWLQRDFRNAQKAIKRGYDEVR